MSDDQPGSTGSAPDRDQDPAELLERFAEFQATGDRALRNELVDRTRSIAEACARRFANRGEPLEDLEQVALVGLVKAVERFDPTLGIPFAGFAVPTVTGEIRRYFRDATWAVKVPRRAKDLHVRLRGAVERLSADLGRPPTADELAAELHTTVDEIVDALDAGTAYRTTSTALPAGEAAAHHALQREGGGGVSPDERVLLADLLESLPERERRVVYLRFFEDRTQAEIAEEVGMSQVHVSRLLRRSLRAMHHRATGDEAIDA